MSNRATLLAALQHARRPRTLTALAEQTGIQRDAAHDALRGLIAAGKAAKTSGADGVQLYRVTREGKFGRRQPPAESGLSPMLKGRKPRQRSDSEPKPFPPCELAPLWHGIAVDPTEVPEREQWRWAVR